MDYAVRAKKRQENKRKLPLKMDEERQTSRKEGISLWTVVLSESGFTKSRNWETTLPGAVSAENRSACDLECGSLQYQPKP